MFGIKKGSVILFFLLFMIIGSFLAILITKALLYETLIVQKRRETHAQMAAAAGLLQYGKQWALEKIEKKQPIQNLFWHGPWWPHTKEWEGFLQIYEKEEKIILIATISKNKEQAISLRSFIKYA